MSVRVRSTHFLPAACTSWTCFTKRALVFASDCILLAGMVYMASGNSSQAASKTATPFVQPQGNRRDKNMQAAADKLPSRVSQPPRFDDDRPKRHRAEGRDAAEHKCTCAHVS